MLEGLQPTDFKDDKYYHQARASESGMLNNQQVVSMLILMQVRSKSLLLPLKCRKSYDLYFTNKRF